MVTNIFVAVIVCMVIMIIGNNLARAFALVGALSIINLERVKDTEHCLYFLVTSAGMASGTGSYFSCFWNNTYFNINLIKQILVL